MKQPLLALPCIATLAAAARPDVPSSSSSSGESSWSSSPPRSSSSSSSSRRLAPGMSDDATYSRIMSLRNQTFSHACYVAVIDGPSNTTYPVVWCDIQTPIGLNVTAEIRDGECEEFDVPASSEYYTMGVASPVLIPEVTEEEKRMGSFDHQYCAGVDVLYDVNKTGTAVSLLSGRFAMEINYSYGPPEERVDEETGEVTEVEELKSAVLTDDNTEAEERDMGLVVGLSVLAGAIVTLALVAMIFGKRKMAAKKKWERVSKDVEKELEEDEGDASVEIAPIVPSSKEGDEKKSEFEIGPAPSKEDEDMIV